MRKLILKVTVGIVLIFGLSGNAYACENQPQKTGNEWNDQKQCNWNENNCSNGFDFWRGSEERDTEMIKHLFEFITRDMDKESVDQINAELAKIEEIIAAEYQENEQNSSEVPQTTQIPTESEGSDTKDSTGDSTQDNTDTQEDTTTDESGGGDESDMTEPTMTPDENVTPDQNADITPTDPENNRDTANSTETQKTKNTKKKVDVKAGAKKFGPIVGGILLLLGGAGGVFYFIKKKQGAQ